jgi:cytosine/adenosine deaminase-related metal-dependent hydrolase
MGTATTIYSARWVIPITSTVIENGGLAVSEGRILSVGSSENLRSLYPDATEENFGKCAIIPGLVNCHTHLELTAMRGFLEDVENDFFAWLRKLTVARMTCMGGDELFASAQLGIIEALSNGVTSVGDASFDAVTCLRAVAATGIRGVAFQEVFGPDPELAVDSAKDLLEKVHRARESESPLASVGVSPHAPYSVSAKLLKATARMAVDEKLPLMIHAAESTYESRLIREGSGAFAQNLESRNIPWTAPGVSPISYLEKVGILQTRPLLAHCIRTDERDWEAIGRNGARIGHCPKSNAKLGHGHAPLSGFLKSGLTVGIGSDSVASNNSGDLIDEARFALLSSRAVEPLEEDRPWISAEQVLEAATIGGARALGLEDKCGSLEEGKQADFAVISLAGVHQQPVYDPVATIIFSSSGRDCILTVVAGEVLYKSGSFTRLDSAAIVSRVGEIAHSFSA